MKLGVEKELGKTSFKNDIRDKCSTDDFLIFWLFTDFAESADFADLRAYNLNESTLTNLK